jgi:regulatory protein
VKNEKIIPKVFSRDQAKVKAESYCAYQERSQYEVRCKLYDWGLHTRDVEEIITELIEGNYLNEARFALAYTLGKFRIKGWGKLKIRQGLKLKQVPEKMITRSLNAIDKDEYQTKLEQLLDKKQAMIKETDPYKVRYLLSNYAVSKGYETDLILKILKPQP